MILDTAPFRHLRTAIRVRCIKNEPVLTMPVIVLGEFFRRYAELRRELKTAGTPIPSNDSWIAATAIAVGVPIVTQDADYDAMPGVQVIKF